MRNPINSPYFFIAPATIFFFLLIVYPAAFTFYVSLFNWTGSGVGNFVGIGNYLHDITDPVVLTSLTNNILLVVGAIPLQVFGALLIAALIASIPKGRTFFRTMVFVPCAMSLVSVAVLWGYIYDPDIGLLNVALRTIGVNARVAWLGDPSLVLFSLLLTLSWQSIGIFVIILLAGIQNISPELYEVAELDRANWYQKFRYITIPSSRTPILICMTLSMVFMMKIFPLVYVMTSGGPVYYSEILVLTAYRYAFRFRSLDYATPITFLLLIVVLLISFLYIRILRER